MPLTAHQTLVDTSVRSLRNLAAVLTKGEAWAQARGVSDEVMLQTRLIADMLPLVKQVQIATDMATRGAARLADAEPESFEDNEVSFAQLHARLDRAIDVIGSYTAEQFEGCEERTIVLKMRSGEMTFRGQDYLLHFVLPNLFFHCTTTYNLLRQMGVELGKADFIGKP